MVFLASFSGLVRSSKLLLSFHGLRDLLLLWGAGAIVSVISLLDKIFLDEQGRHPGRSRRDLLRRLVDLGRASSKGPPAAVRLNKCGHLA